MLSSLITKLRSLELSYLDGCVGAHVGFHTGEEINNYNDLNCKYIYGFEPVPAFFSEAVSQLKKIAKSGYLTTEFDLRPFGCGETEGNSVINVFSGASSGFSSIKSPDINILKTIFGKDTRHNFDNLEKQEIKIVRLDDQINFSRGLDFLVIDTQGYELECLKGALKCLEYVKLIEVEITMLKDPLYRDAPPGGIIANFLGKYGFHAITSSNIYHGSVLFAKY